MVETYLAVGALTIGIMGLAELRMALSLVGISTSVSSMKNSYLVSR
jgi:hypothetical protein